MAWGSYHFWGEVGSHDSDGNNVTHASGTYKVQIRAQKCDLIERIFKDFLRHSTDSRKGQMQ